MRDLKLFILLILFILILYSIFIIPRKNKKYLDSGNYEAVKRLKLYDIIFASILFLVSVIMLPEIELKLIYTLIFIIHLGLSLLVTKTNDTEYYNLNKLDIFGIIILIIKAIFSPNYSFNSLKDTLKNHYIFVVFSWLTLFALAVPAMLALIGML